MRLVHWVALGSALIAAGAGPSVQAAQPCCGEAEFQGVDVASEDVVIELVELKRVGPDVVQATWTLRNKSKQDQRLTKGGSGWSDGYHLAYDASLQDMSARVKFPVAKDSEGTPLAGKQPTVPYKGIWLKAGKTTSTWAKFLVPASTTQVDVSLPGASAPWNNVAITP